MLGGCKRLIDRIVSYAISTIFQPYNGVSDFEVKEKIYHVKMLMPKLKR